MIKFKKIIKNPILNDIIKKKTKNKKNIKGKKKKRGRLHRPKANTTCLGHVFFSF
jgi:hypothetical protein